MPQDHPPRRSLLNEVGVAGLIALAAAEVAKVLGLKYAVLTYQPGATDYLQAGAAGLGVVALFAICFLLWLAIGRMVSPAQDASLLRHWPSAAVHFGLPAGAVLLIAVWGTNYWVPHHDLVYLVAASLVFLSPLASLLAKGLRIQCRALAERSPSAWRLLSIAAIVAVALIWYLGTSRFRASYGRLHLVSFATMMACVVAVRSLGPVKAVAETHRRSWLVWAALALVGAVSLAATPTTPALELFYSATPYRWVLTPLRSLQLDRDGDGATVSFGYLVGNDCDDSDAGVRPGEVDIPGNGVDENCFGGDLSPDAVFFEDHETPHDPSLPPLNILFLVIDAWRFDLEQPLGIDGELMPNVARLADRSLQLTNYRTCGPGTRLSVPDLLAGNTIGPEVNAQNLPAIHALTRSGYHTVFLNNLTIEWLIHSLAQGFSARYLIEEFLDYHEDEILIDQLSNLLADSLAEPFFVYSHLLDAHSPYLVDDKCTDDMPRNDRYYCALGHIDGLLGPLFEQLRESGLMGRTVVVVTADHGESLGAHGVLNHTDSVYDELLHVPLVIWNPRRGAGVVSEPANCFDATATMLATANAPIDALLFGQDFSGANPPTDGTQFARQWEMTKTPQANRHRFAVVYRGHKFVYDLATRLRSFYDLESDPYEEDPLPGVGSELEDALVLRMDAWLSELARREASSYHARDLMDPDAR